ncbi:MAG: UbiD family decarboxylase [Chloroflexi bacterium]|nr:UbiD family decarboxylase [Chloroflexota bacterium]
MALSSACQVTDLRSALEVAERRGELVRISRSVDPGLELPSVMRAMREFRSKPAVLFEQIAGHPGLKGCSGLFSERARVADLLGISADSLSSKATFLDALDHPIPPTMVSTGPCKENVVTKDIDVNKLLFSTRGANHSNHEYYQPVVIIKNPITGQYNTSIYRSCVQGPDTVTVNIRWNQHGGYLLSMAKERGLTFPVALCIGVDPAIYVAALTKMPLGFNELGFAGAIRGKPIELVPCETIDLAVPAGAEFIIEGEIRPPYRLGDDGPWPEYFGYLGMNIHPPIMDITAVTHRDNPINYLFVPHAVTDVMNMGTDAQFYRHLKAFAGDFVVDTRLDVGYHRVLVKLKKTESHHEGLQISVAYAALGFDCPVDNVILVDEDIDIYDEARVWWAINTRCNPARQVHVLPEARTHQNCPIAGVREMLDEPINKGKMIIDATVPWNMRHMEKGPGITYFTQSNWPEVELADFLEASDLEKLSRAH